MRVRCSVHGDVAAVVDEGGVICCAVCHVGVDEKLLGESSNAPPRFTREEIAEDVEVWKRQYREES